MIKLAVELRNQILFGMKRKSKFFIFYFLLVFSQLVVSSCNNGVSRNRNDSSGRQKERELVTGYTPDSLIGKWKILYVC